MDSRNAPAGAVRDEGYIAGLEGDVIERKRILIVEASESDRRRLEACLSSEYEVRSVPTLCEADAITCDFRPHLVIETAPERPEPAPDAPDPSCEFEGMVGACDSMREVFSLLRRAASTDAGVLITGECGTGKQLAARVIHSLSSRSDGRFVTLNAEAFEPSRLAVELFGRPNGSSGPLRGALEQADGGTLLLGGLERMSSDLQDKLLSYLRTGAFRRTGGDESVGADVRMLVASDRPLDSLVERGDVRRDLFYRLGVVTVALPPLRERGNDVVLLAGHFLAKRSPGDGNSVEGFARDAVSAMVSHDWPGNIAEMENRICRSLIVAEGPRVTPKDLGLDGGNGRTERTLREARDQLTVNMVVEALRQAVGNVSKAARSIGVSRATMYDLIHKHGLDVSGFKALPGPASQCDDTRGAP